MRQKYHYSGDDPNAFKEIEENPAKLDFSGCMSAHDLHMVLRKGLRLPENYCDNWDSLRNLLLSFRPYLVSVELHGVQTLPEALGDEINAMLTVFKCVSCEAPLSHVVATSDNPYAYKDIEENPVKLDFSDCKYEHDVHIVLKNGLGLPDYYGENWDALWDMISDFRDYPIEIELHGIHALRSNFDYSVGMMLNVFDDVMDRNPHIRFIVIS